MFNTLLLIGIGVVIGRFGWGVVTTIYNWIASKIKGSK